MFTIKEKKRGIFRDYFAARIQSAVVKKYVGHRRMFNKMIYSANFCN